MTPDAFRAELARLGLTQASAGRFLEVDERTIRRWAAQGGAPKAVRMLFERLTSLEVSAELARLEA